MKKLSDKELCNAALTACKDPIILRATSIYDNDMSYTPINLLVEELVKRLKEKELNKREKNLLRILLRSEFDANMFGVVLRDEELDKRIISISKKLELGNRYVNEMIKDSEI